MNRIAVESIAGGRRISTGSHQLRRDLVATTGDYRDGEDTLDLFARTRASTGGGGGVLTSPAAGHNEAIRLERISVGAPRIGRGGMEDFLDAEIGKHDYDWLLTPPETPLYPSSVAKESPLSKESQLSSATPRSRSTARSISNTRPSRLSTSQTENGHSTRPVRSSSVTRPSISSNYSSSSMSNSNNRTSILNTSSASVTSSRPSTPGSRSTAGRPSTSTTMRPSMTNTTSRPSITSTVARSSTASRPIGSRLPTPTKTRPNPTPSGDRIIRPSHNSRPSTPTSSRPQTPSNPNPNSNIYSRPSSRPSTPTRGSSTAGSSAPSAGIRYPSVGRIPAGNNRNPAAPASRPSSPGPRVRAPVRPIDLPDFPNDVPPNLRTKLPERPASTGRTRPGMSLTVRANPNPEAVVPAVAVMPATSNRRNYMPVVSRSKFPENPPKGGTRLHGNSGHEPASLSEIQKPAAPEVGLRRPAKQTSATESTGFGRTISKKSLDMALRHMDIRQGMGGIRASSLFPQSIRSTSTSTKVRPVRKSDPVVPLASNEVTIENASCNGTFSPAYSMATSENEDFAIAKSPDRDSIATRESDMDIQGSSRYEVFMKEEDSKNMSWLHSVEDKSDQSPVFDHRFEPLPEPFGML